MAAYLPFGALLNTVCVRLSCPSVPARCPSRLDPAPIRTLKRPLNPPPPHVDPPRRETLTGLPTIRAFGRQAFFAAINRVGPAAGGPQAPGWGVFGRLWGSGTASR